MGTHGKTLNYTKYLLRDEAGVLWWIPLLLFAVQTGVGIAKGRRAASTQKHAYERQLGYEFQAAVASKEMDIEKIKELRLLNESRLEVARASGFQRGSYMGPFFQVVQK